MLRNVNTNNIVSFLNATLYRSSRFSTNRNRIRRTSQFSHHEYFKHQRVTRNFTKTIINALSDDKLFKNYRQRSRIFGFSSIIIALLFCCTLLLYFEKYEPTLKGLTNTMTNLLLRNTNVHDMAVSFTKGVLEDVMNNKDLRQVAAKLVQDIIIDSQDAIEGVLLKAISSEETLKIVNDVARTVSENLCNDEGIQEKVGHLLLQSIKTRAAVEGAAKWVVDLSERDDIIESLTILISQKIFGDKFMQGEALNFCKNIMNDLLTDSGTIQNSVDFIKSVLERQEIQSRMAQSLWDVFKLTLYPKWLITDDREQFPNVEPTIIDKIQESSDIPYFY